MRRSARTLPGVIVPLRARPVLPHPFGIDPATVQRVDDPAGRYYLLPPPHPSWRFPSVTTVCGVVRQPYLETWRGRVGNDAADLKLILASDFGTAVHRACEARIWGEPVDEHLEPWADGVARWIGENVSEILATEIKLWSMVHVFAGTPDLVCRLLDGRLAIVDYKTSSQCGPLFVWQMGGYALAWEELYGERPDAGIVLRFKKDPPKRKSTPILKPYEYQDADMIRARRAFLHARALWDDIHEWRVWE